MILAPRYFAPRYFAPRYFGTRRSVEAGGVSGAILPFIAPTRIFTAGASGGLEWGGRATIATTRAIPAQGGLEWSGLAATVTVRLIQAQGGRAWDGSAMVATSKFVLSDGGLEWDGMAVTFALPTPDRWAKAREEDELWLLMI